MLKQNLRGCP